MPIAVKDEFDVAGEVTTFGTNAYGEPAREDSEIVRRVRAAGAVVIGKTHMPELGAFPWTESPTWGVTRNPWDPQRSPGGSSGGSAAAVAAGLVGAALAGDGAGSIRFPAPGAGLFGLKTQRGRVPLAPHLDAWHGLCVNGVVARSVRDSALFYDAIAERTADRCRPRAERVPGGARSGEAAARRGRALRCGSRSRASCRPRALDGDAERALDETVALLRSLGHEVEYERDPDYGQLAISRVHGDLPAQPVRGGRHICPPGASGTADTLAGAPGRPHPPTARWTGRSGAGRRACRAAECACSRTTTCC